LIYFLSSIIVLETLGLIACGYYLLRFARIIMRVEDAIESSLDLLDERYKSVSKILEIPLFYDSPEIKRVVDDVKASREVILNVANSIANIEEYQDEG
jgi:hypothetical protein